MRNQHGLAAMPMPQSVNARRRRNRPAQQKRGANKGAYFRKAVPNQTSEWKALRASSKAQEGKMPRTMVPVVVMRMVAKR